MKRRSFLKVFGLGTAAVTIAPQVLLEETPKGGIPRAQVAEAVKHVFRNTTPDTGRVIKLYTGEYGYKMFNEALKREVNNQMRYYAST